MGKPVEEQYCLSQIPCQPEEYDGPVRFCTRQQLSCGPPDNYRCKFHGGTSEGEPENLDKLAPMKHGMHATREHLIEDFDDKDEALYEWIIGTWPEAYDIDIENDPNAAYDFHRLAAEVVRAERGRGFIIEEGEVNEQERVSDEGNVVVGDDGEVVTEKSEHYLAGMMQRQDNKITSLERELGITRKERQKQDSTDDAVDAIKGFANLGAAFLDKGSGDDYDPEDEPWQSDDG